MLLPSFIFLTAWTLGLPCLANFTQNITRELHRRVRVGGSSGPGGVGGIRDLFKIDEFSDCEQHIDTLDAWVQEAATLHTGLEHAFRHAELDRVKRHDDDKKVGIYISHWRIFFGLQWDPYENEWEDDEFDNQILASIKDHIERVTQFLSGGGLREARTGEMPRLFCSGAPFERQEPGRAARGINGEDIVLARDDTTGLPTEYLTIERAFSTQLDGGNNVFWVPAFNGYDFSKRDAICGPISGGSQLLGRSGRPYSSPDFNYWNGERRVPYDLGKSSRHMILCPAAFASASKSHSVASLSETVGSLYPSGPEDKDDSIGLDRMLTRSSTFYHELFHITDKDDTLRSGQEIYNLNNLIAAAHSTITQYQMSHNPESYVFLAQALHMFRNPPNEERRVIYTPSFPSDPTMFGHNPETWERIAGLP